MMRKLPARDVIWPVLGFTGTNKGITLGGGAPASQSVYGKFRGYNHPDNPRLRVTYYEVRRHVRASRTH